MEICFRVESKSFEILFYIVNAKVVMRIIEVVRIIEMAEVFHLD